MRRPLTLALLLAAPLAAQGGAAHAHADADVAAKGGGRLPAGWQARTDDATAKLANVKFVATGTSYHFTTGPAAIFWNPRDKGMGPYIVSASFAQTRAPSHPEAYGLFVGGQALQAPTQRYLYFLVRGDGKYMIKHRAGTAVHTIANWTDHAALAKQDAAGKATNKLAIAVGADSVRFMANGQQVTAIARAQAMDVDGQAGIRINHNLDVAVDGFAVTRGKR